MEWITITKASNQRDLSKQDNQHLHIGQVHQLLRMLGHVSFNRIWIIVNNRHRWLQLSRQMTIGTKLSCLMWTNSTRSKRKLSKEFVITDLKWRRSWRDKFKIQRKPRKLKKDKNLNIWSINKKEEHKNNKKNKKKHMCSSKNLLLKKKSEINNLEIKKVKNKSKKDWNN